MDYTIAIGLQLFDNFSRQLLHAQEQFSKLQQEIEKTQTGLNKLGEAFKKAFDPKVLWETSEKFENFSAKIAQATALPMATFTKMLGAFSELEDARVEMEVAFMTSTGLPEEMEKINKIAEELGTKLPGSATHFYRLATALKQAGLSAKDIAEGIFEGAGYAWVLFKNEVSPDQAGEYMAEFANAFRIPANQFMDFVDKLQRLKFASGLTLTEIAYSTKYFSAELQQLGVTGLKAFDIMSAWLGTLKQVGLKGETAGTSIRAVLHNISKLDENLEKLKKKGIDLQISAKDFFDEKGAFKLEEFLITIKNRLSEIHDPIQRMQILQTLFDTEGMRAITPLLIKTKEEALAFLDSIKNTLSPEEYQRLRKQIEEGKFSGLEGMAKKLNEQASLWQRINKVINTFKNVLESLMGTLEQVGAIIGSLVAPSLKILFNFLNNLLSKVSNFITTHKTLSSILVYTIGAFVGLLTVLGALSLVLGTVLKLFSIGFAPIAWIIRTNLVRGLTSAIWQNMIAFIKWAITGTTSTNWLKSLDFFLLKAKLSMLQLIGVIRMKIIALRAMAWAWITSPIGLITAGIATLIVIGYVLYRNWDKISKALVTAWNWLKTNWQKVLQVFLWINPFTAPIMALNKLVQYVYRINLFDAGARIIKTLWEGMKSLASKPVEVVKNIAQKIRNMLPFSPVKEGPLSTLHKVDIIGTIAENIKPAPLISAMQKSLQVIRASIEPLIQPVKQVLEPMKAFAQPLIQPVKQVLEPPKLSLQPASSAPVSIVVNLGGINISGKTSEKEVKEIATNLEKEIRSVLEKIAVEKFRRQY